MIQSRLAWCKNDDVLQRDSCHLGVLQFRGISVQLWWNIFEFLKSLTNSSKVYQIHQNCILIPQKRIVEIPRKCMKVGFEESFVQFRGISLKLWWTFLNSSIVPRIYEFFSQNQLLFYMIIWHGILSLEHFDLRLCHERF